MKISRILTFSLRSCKSKHHVDVIDTRNCKIPLLPSDNLDGRKCPPASPIISPLNKSRNKRPCGFEDHERTNLFNCEYSIGRERVAGTTRTRRRRAAEETLAVVKRSRDPYSDFRRSMVEMIVEKQIFGANELENLLEAFLRLNACHHHKLIVQVFSDIYHALILY